MSFRRSFGSVFVALALVAGTLAATPDQARADDHDDVIGEQLALASATLAQAAMLPDLLPVIPGIEGNASMVLGFHEIFAGNDDGFAGLISLATSSDLATDILALTNGEFTFSTYIETTSGTVHTVSFDIAVDRSYEVPLTIMEDGIQILGSPVTIAVTMPATTITMEVDTANPAATFAFTNLPTFSLTASLDGSPTIPIQFGFAEATASGDFDINFKVDLELSDPDGLDRITGAELGTLAIDDLIQLDFPDNDPAGDQLNVDLTLTADVFGTAFGGTLTISDANLFKDPAPNIELAATGTNPISLLTNIGADTAITSLAQLVSGYGAAMIAGDVSLPFLSDGVLIPGDLGSADLADFDQVFDVIGPLMEYVTPRSSGQIVCGTTVGPDPDGGDPVDGGGPVQGIPTRAVRDLDPNQPVYCRAYASQNGTVVWTANGTNQGGAPTTIGLEPTTNIELAANGAGEFAVEAEFTPEDGSGAVTIKPRPQTIQELLTELHDAELIPDPSTITDLYDADLEAFQFPIDMTVAGKITREASIDAGNSLVADTGLTGLSADASASASYSISGISAGVTLGLIVTDDDDDINPSDNQDSSGNDVTGPGDRFFLSGIDSILEVGIVELEADLEMVGRLGFLEVGATISGNLTTPGGDPALAVGLIAGAGVTVKGNSDPDAILIRDLLSTELLDRVNAVVNLEFAGTAAVSAMAAGLSASGGFPITWNLNDPTPTIGSFTGDFETALLPFAGDLELTQDGPADAGDPGATPPIPPDTTLFTGTSAVNLLAEPGLVGSQLVDSTGNVCNITAVLSATQLNCSNADPAAGVVNPIAFADGQTYEVKGNTLSKLADILAALDGLVMYLEDAVGSDSFDTPIDLIGVSPADIVGQIGELRRMVDEFRGVQDAYITCVVDGDPDADIRAIPLADPPVDVSIKCAADAFAESPTNVQWRIAGDSGFTADPDGGSVASGPDPAAVGEALTVRGAPLDTLDTNGDGFVALGSEYTVEVEWTDGTGDHQAAFPPRIPQSLQKLEDLINETLGLPAGVLEFELVTTPADPTLRINLGYGICSSQTFIPDCAGMPTGPRPSANLNLDLSGAGLPDLVGLDVIGTIDVDYAALGQFDVGIPLTGAAPVLYGTTGLEARLQVAGSNDLGIEASLGPASALAGAGATGLVGTADADSATTLTVSTSVFTPAEVSTGMVVTNTDTGDSCVVSARTDDDNVECALDWTAGDGFEFGNRNDLNAGIAVEIQLTDAADVVVSDSAFVTFTDAGVNVPNLAEVLNGGECGPILEGEMLQIAGSAVGTAERALNGLACAQLSLAVDLGGVVTYLGEVDVELTPAANPVRAWVPSDLSAKLENAALNPAFLFQLLPELLELIEDGMRSAADSGVPSAVGDPLRTGADGLAATRQLVDAFIDTFGGFLETELGGPLEGEIADALEGLLGLTDTITIVAECRALGGGTETCDDTHSLADVRDLNASFTFGDMVEASTGVNIGLEGLPLKVEGGVRAFAEWDVTIGLGVSFANGPYIALDGGAEFLVSAGVALDAGASCDPSSLTLPAGVTYAPERCLTARLGFLDIEALDRNETPTIIGAHLGLDVLSTGADPDKLTLGDLVSGSVTLTPELAAGINIDLHLRTGIASTGADLPTILGTFGLSWQIGTFVEDPDASTFVTLEGITIPTPVVTFGNLHLDIGEVLNEFLKPIADEIKKITGPLQPIVDVITAPIPVVSDLAELVGGEPVTMISILELAADADMALIRALAAFITFVNSIPDGAGLTPIPLGALAGGVRQAGEFSVDATKAAGSISSTEAGSLIKQDGSFKGGKGFTKDVGDTASTGKAPLNSYMSPDDRPSTFGVPGLSFPFLEDASQIFGVLVGRDATLIRWDAGTLKASAGLSYDFGPIMVGPVPITITIGGEIGIEGRFAIGYDTSGIRKLLDGGSGTALFDGIFIDDLDANGNDVPEITFFGRVFAGASVDLVIVSAGVRGGIELTFTLDLDDRPDPDGKLRIEEIVDKLANPICLFEVGGKIEAFLEAFVKIDLFFFSKEFSFELVRITLLEWSSACEPPAPDPSSQDGDVLTLHMGSLATERNVQEDEINERFEVRQLGPGKVRVTAFGFEEVATGVGLIVADGGIGDDEILFLPGSDDADADAPPIQFTIPVVVTGGPGNDIIKTGDAADLIYGDAALADGTWETVDYTVPDPQDDDDGEPGDGDDGNDVVNAGEGQDVVKTDGGNDQVEGEGDRDTIEGGDGNDQLNGGPGGDAVLGQAGSDSVHGGPIAQPQPGATTAQIDDNDALSGGFDIDTLSGDFGDDVMFGDNPLGTIMAPDADMRRLGYTSKPSLTTWRAWCDTVVAGGAADVMVGNAGDDLMVGGAGDDQMDGDEGNDWACGSDGEDEVIGGDGNDELRGNGDNDTLEGNADDDVIFGGDGNDVANGNDGNDDIFGDGGSDLLFGDDGDDIVVGDTGSVADGHSHGVDGASIDEAKVLAMDLDVTRDSSTSATRRVDCDPANATADSDCIFGGFGSDALFGGSDGDIIQGQAGSDLIEGNDGADLIRGGTNQDLLFGNEDSDDMFGDGDHDLMYGDRDIAAWATNKPTGAAVDTMNGGPGADHMEGDGGDDVMFGGADPDHMEGNNGDDTMFGESGNDDMIGGSDNDDGELDTGETLMSGGLGNDVMTGDNAEITTGGYVGGRSIALHDPTIGGGDTMEGDAATDYMFGQAGNDTMHGDDGAALPFLGVGAGDYMEGNDGDDTMFGETGNDDMVGGSSAADGVIVAGRDGTGAADIGETLMSGGLGDDWMSGDNARMDRVLAGLSLGDPLNPLVLFDLAGTDKPAVPASAHGGDTMQGDDGTDLMFGQGSKDIMSGGDMPDYMEGNDGDDTMSGNSGDDDMVGGGSAYDGIIDEVRVGEKLWDEGETLMSGGTENDWMAGDNAFMNRVLFPASTLPLTLFDVNSSDEGLVSGGDTMEGDEDDDLMFGQGNGAQANQSDPPDGADNDGDGAIDEDALWLGDTISGGDNDDYVEGNQGADLIFGNDGDDDLIGGGSARNGVFVPDRLGNGLWDERDTVSGGDGEDVITGDNARINRGAPVTGLLLANDREVLLFDVDSGDNALSGGDFLVGGAERDLMFGQGNGAQSADQADPLDFVDNDFDGREGPDSVEYDCADNGFDNDGDGDADALDSGCSGASVLDEDQPWDGDIMLGDAGDDYMEGNAGADWMFGGDDEDDMIGGGSANDGAIVPDRDPKGLLDGSDVMHGEAEDDVMTGDNARINRVDVGAAWDRLSSAGVASEPGFGPYDQAVRVTDMFPGDAGADSHDNDYMTGGLGNDEMYGQLGDDFMLANAGDDALVGDLGQVRANLMGDGVGIDPARQVIATNSPHWEDTVYEVGSLLWETELYAYDTSAGGVGGNDVLLGYDGRDTAFGGPGHDVINGDGDGTEEYLDLDNPEFTHVTDTDPATVDQDMLFGGDDGDSIWGGRDNDILMGGHGDDFLDVRPREETDNGRNGAKFRIIPRDRPLWFTYALPENFQDADFIYGGWDRDALQADQAENGPDPGDRLADWAGGFNIFYLCPSGYGDHTVTRMGSPHSREFLRDLTQASGAFMTSVDGASGFRDLGYVFPDQRGQNSHPPHPDHPGHFTCIDYVGIGSGGASAEAGGPYVIDEGGTVVLDGTASTGEGGITVYTWDPTAFAIDDPTWATPTIDASDLDDGVETVELEIVDGDGGMAMDIATVTIHNVAPTVSIDALADVADGEPVALTASFTDPGALDTHTTVVDWGDGTTTSTLSDTHTYAGSGDYTVEVEVTDDDGGVGVATATVTVGGAPIVGVSPYTLWSATNPWPADPISIGGTSYTRSEAIVIFDDGKNNEQSPFLFRELVTALLNQAAGADTSCVDTLLTDADAWLNAHPPGSKVNASNSAWTGAGQGRGLRDALRAYNDGLACAPPA